MRAYALFVVSQKNGSLAVNPSWKYIVKAHLEWTDKPEPGIKRKVRITFIKSRDIKWQFKRSDEEHWDYDHPPTLEDWDTLEKKTEALYQRRRMKYDHLDLIRQQRPKKNHD